MSMTGRRGVKRDVDEGPAGVKAAERGEEVRPTREQDRTKGLIVSRRVDAQMGGVRGGWEGVRVG